MLRFLLVLAATAGALGAVAVSLARPADARAAGAPAVLDEVAELDRAIAAAATARSAAEERMHATETEVESLRTRATALAGGAARAALTARGRVRALYVASRGAGLAYLAGAGSLGELARREQVESLAVRRDLAAVRGYLRARRVAAAAAVRLDARAAALRALRAELDTYDAAVRAERDRKTSLAARVAADPSLRHALDGELARAASALDAMVGRHTGAAAAGSIPPSYARPDPGPPPLPGAAAGSISISLARPPLTAGSAASPAFAARRGKLPWPVAGATVERPFGPVADPDSGTLVSSKGWDLRAAPGTPVLAVAAGRVLFAGWYRGYGNLVIVDHGGEHHTLYAHLGSLAKGVGEVLAAGDYIGGVGDTGSLKGSYLYFEIRVKGAAADPARWLAPSPAD